MSGIYLHIPFCKQACSYCNFHFTVNLNDKDSFLKALHAELELRKAYLEGSKIETIYFGGGTPSLLSATELNRIFDKLHQLFEVQQDAEVTLEANPDDLTKEKISELRQTPVNRFSIGIQSFHDDDLRFLNRAHNSGQAESSVKLAQDAGFENITVDLIYGIPEWGRGAGDEGRQGHAEFIEAWRKPTPPFDSAQGDTDRAGIAHHNKWASNLEKLKQLSVPHFSAYCLTIEQKTALEKMIREKKAPAVSDEEAATHFEMLMDFASKNDYDHYEISNFAKAGRYSRHNTAYWTGKKYLGLGPSAHSFDGKSRQWNIANNTLYIQSLLTGELNFQREELTDNDRFNEYVMTSLRTQWGIDTGYVKKHFEEHKFTMLEKNTSKFIEDDLLSQQDDIITLTKKGKLVADRIICDLFETE